MLKLPGRHAENSRHCETQFTKGQIGGQEHNDRLFTVKTGPDESVRMRRSNSCAKHPVDADCYDLSLRTCSNMEATFCVIFTRQRHFK